jgi:N-methylhydantoinase A
VSVARGIDPRTMALLPFGGAGPLFGCALADALGMPRIVIPPHPGVLSALGLAAAPERIDVLASMHRAIEVLSASDLAQAFRPLLDAANGALQGARLTRLVDCRFAGQGYEVTVDAADNPAAIASSFRAAHQARHGHADPEQPIEIVNLRVVAERTVQEPRLKRRENTETAAPQHRAIVTRQGQRCEAQVWRLDALPREQRLTGPTLLAGPDATALIEPGWGGRVHESGAVLLERT